MVDLKSLLGKDTHFVVSLKSLETLGFEAKSFSVIVVILAQCLVDELQGLLGVAK